MKGVMELGNKYQGSEMEGGGGGVRKARLNLQTILTIN